MSASRRLVSLSLLGFLAACSSAESRKASPDETDGSGGISGAAGAAGVGGASATGGSAPSGGGGATGGSGGSAVSTGGGGGTAGVPTAGGNGSGGIAGTGAEGGTSGTTSGAGGGGSPATGGSAGVGGLPTTGGAAASGGSGAMSGSGGKSSGGSGGTATGGSGGSPTVDDQGCPLTLEGFATLEGAVTGGAAGPVVTVSNQADLERYAGANEPYVIRVSGTITLSPAGTEVRVRSNKSIIGLGTNAKIDEGGFFLAVGVNNVIFRNLTIGGTGHFAVDDPGRDLHDWDGIQMDTAHHVWVDHCHFEDIYDGMIDVRMDSNFITLSWNHFKNHLKSVGIGWTENVITKITLHHNFFDNCEKRNPNCDNAYCHSYNNILEDVDEQGSLAYGGASLRIENGVFRNSTRPWYAAESTAMVTQTGSLTENISNSKSNGEAFNARDFYDYHLDPANVLDDLVKRCVGPRAALGR